jgi:hypothetical protein
LAKNYNPHLGETNSNLIEILFDASYDFDYESDESYFNFQKGYYCV